MRRGEEERGEEVIELAWREEERRGGGEEERSWSWLSDENVIHYSPSSHPTGSTNRLISDADTLKT